MDFLDTSATKYCRNDPLIMSQFCHFSLTFAHSPSLCLNLPVISFANFLVMIVWCLAALTLMNLDCNWSRSTFLMQFLLTQNRSLLRVKCWLICVFKLSVGKYCCHALLTEQNASNVFATTLVLTDLLLCIFRNIQHWEEGQAVEELSPTDAQARKDWGYLA